MATLSDDDEGKDVVTAGGEKIGIVKEVDRGTAYVDPNAGLTDELKSVLGWGDRDEDTYPIKADAVAETTDDELHLDRGR
ncbi:PRC-barrel domain containing protein [Halomicroarcula limicola]|uniref:PRC-barrel domain containing protein n=1 Tax=Haloarcula limicola TaxID=1429915 RepID=A0A8J8C329_9EURY|nr:PRC-barrel domain containing protein [Halomicroarcula limicola]MBV0923981.1 PRC-barrel domain containing protein [Halomicroarcula limicola]